MTKDTVTTEFVEQGDHSWIEVVFDDGGENRLGVGEVSAISEALDIAAVRRRPVIVFGRDDVFSAGLVAAPADDEAAAERLERICGDLLAQAAAQPTPLIVAAAGDALGAAGLLCLTADVALLAKGDARVGVSDVREGRAMSEVAVEIARATLTPDVLLEATAHGRLFGPAAAVAAGFSDEVVAGGELAGWARERAARLGALDADAFAATKRLVRRELIDRLGVLLP
jgi:enoyl-CoA hydratase